MFNVIFFEPIFNLIVGLYKLFGNNLGLAIIGIAIFSRIITLPIMTKQLRTAQKLKDIQPRLDKLKKKYKDDKQKLNQKQLELYKEMGINPIGGCLPMIVQLIFLVQVRNVVVTLLEQGVSSFNDIAYFNFLKFPADFQINLNFLGIDLSKVAANFSWSDPQIIPYVILAVLVGLTQLFSTKMMTPGIGVQPEIKNEEIKKKHDDEPSFENMSKMMSKQMMYFLPALTVFMSLGYSAGSSFFSAALSIFWTVQNVFVIVQRALMNRDLKVKLVGRFVALRKK